MKVSCKQLSNTLQDEAVYRDQVRVCFALAMVDLGSLSRGSGGSTGGMGGLVPQFFPRMVFEIRANSMRKSRGGGGCIF